VTDKAASLLKIDPISKNFYVDNKMAIIINHNIIYKGEITDEKKNGLGIAIFSDGRIYKGKWKDDLPSGKGMYKTNFGFTVIGEFDPDFNIISSDAKFYVSFILYISI